MKLTRIVYVLATCLLSALSAGSNAFADIQVELIRQGVPETYPLPNEPALGPNIQIPADLGVTLSNVTMIRVYTDDPATESIGQIAIIDTRSTNNPLDVLVSSQSFFPFTPLDTLSSGALNWDGITCSTDCKAAVRLAAGVNGSVTGSVNVGQIFRLQAAGSIMQSVHASNADGVPQPGFAISVINAGSISGEVQAELGTIDTVAATSPSFGGLIGNVLAPAGRIVRITSAKEIGVQSSLEPVHIEAKLGIGSIEATAINADIKADVNSGTGVINLVKTTGTSNSGHFKGALRSHGLQAGSGESGVLLTGKLMAPVAIEGSCAAPITLAGDCESAISVSTNVTAPITIAGSVTANAPITVGGNVAAPITATGSISAPISIAGSVAANSEIRAARFTQPISISGALKSNIRATASSTEYSIYEINVGSLELDPFTSLVLEVEGTGTGRKIRKLIVGGEISGGALSGWRIHCSDLGLLETGASGGSGDAVFSLFRNSSSTIGSEVTADDSVAVDEIKIRGTFAGQIHVSSFGIINIDEHAGGIYFWQPYAAGTTNGSFQVGRSCNGLIAFRSVTGLRDSVIVNQRAEDGADFGGIVAVALPSSLSTSANSPVAGVLPDESSVYGGGSIALWPYRLYRADCFPSHGFFQGSEQDDLKAYEFSAPASNEHSRSVRIRFTGPIFQNPELAASLNPVRLEFVRLYNGMVFNTPIDDADFVATIQTSAVPQSSREIAVKGSGSYIFAPGLYRVTLNPDAIDDDDAAISPVLCRGIVDASGSETNPPLPEFEYFFWLANNCAPCTCLGLCTVGDYDQNGGIDGGDIGAFFSDFEAGNPDADVDLNGGIDGGDLVTFFCWFEAGGC